jgi:hypothetical protein
VPCKSLTPCRAGDDEGDADAAETADGVFPSEPFRACGSLYASRATSTTASPARRTVCRRCFAAAGAARLDPPRLTVADEAIYGVVVVVVVVESAAGGAPYTNASSARVDVTRPPFSLFENEMLSIA